VQIDLLKVQLAFAELRQMRRIHVNANEILKQAIPNSVRIRL
jgi:hypothetical protein